VYLPATTPILSNIGYQLLGYALENITGRSFNEMFYEHMERLGMTSSSLTAPEYVSNAIIPSTPDFSGWSTDYGDTSP
jgi:CubicO group peptidase (beta-lactamase class C family)